MTIHNIPQKIIPVLEEYGIIYAGIFGSFARGQATDKSDVDILVKFGHPIGMFTYMRFVNRLESLLQRKVDVVTEESLSKFVKPYILSDLKTVYEK